MPKLWLAIGWKVLVHLPPGHLPPHILGHLPLHSMDQVLDEKAVDASQGMVKLVRELGGMVANKQVYLEVPYWVADEDNIEVMKVV